MWFHPSIRPLVPKEHWVRLSLYVVSLVYIFTLVNLCTYWRNVGGILSFRPFAALMSVDKHIHTQNTRMVTQREEPASGRSQHRATEGNSNRKCVYVFIDSSGISYGQPNKINKKEKKMKRNYTRMDRKLHRNVGERRYILGFVLQITFIEYGNSIRICMFPCAALVFCCRGYLTIGISRSVSRQTHSASSSSSSIQFHEKYN